MLSWLSKTIKPTTFFPDVLSRKRLPLPPPIRITQGALTSQLPCQALKCQRAERGVTCPLPLSGSGGCPAPYCAACDEEMEGESSSLRGGVDLAPARKKSEGRASRIGFLEKSTLLNLRGAFSLRRFLRSSSVLVDGDRGAGDEIKSAHCWTRSASMMAFVFALREGGVRGRPLAVGRDRLRKVHGPGGHGGRGMLVARQR